jgi:hypothetical protein
MRRRAAVPKPPTPSVAPLSERIGDLLRRAQPFAYCDACLADYFVVPFSAAQRAARRLGATDGYARKLRRCRTCQELTDVTWRVRPVSSFLFWGRGA